MDRVDLVVRDKDAAFAVVFVAPSRWTRKMIVVVVASQAVVVVLGIFGETQFEDSFVALRSGYVG